MTLSASATTDIGFGSTQGYAGALIPFSGTVSSEQNPTITCTPVGGDRVLRQFAAETPVELAIMLFNTAHSHKAAWIGVVRRVNNIRNPDVIDPPALVAEPASRRSRY